MQQEHRIGPAGDGYSDPMARFEHAITNDGFCDPLNHNFDFIRVDAKPLREENRLPNVPELAAPVKLLLMDVDGDLTDVVVMQRVGLAIATGNARVEVKQEAHYVTKAVGGAGAVREVVEMILKTQGSWNEILEKYEVPSVGDSHRIGFSR